MKQSLVYIFIVILISSCSVSNKSKVKGYNLSLTNSQKDYLFTEASKLKLLGNYDRSKKLFTEYLKVNKESDASYYQLAQIYSMEGDFSKARYCIDHAIDIDTSNIWYLRYLISVAKNQNDILTIVDAQKSIVKKEPDNLRAKYELAVYLNFANKLDESLLLLNNIEKEKGISEEVSLYKYEIYKKKKLDNDAIAEIKKLIEKFPEETNYYGIIAEHYLNENSLNIAKPYYDKLFEIDPNNIEGKISYGKYQFAKGKNKEAEKLYTDLLSDTTLSNELKLNILMDLINSPFIIQYGGSELSNLIDVYKKNSGGKNINALKANFYLKNNDANNALYYLKRTIEEDSTNYFAWEQVILIENSLRHLDSVVKYSSEALEIFPEHSNLYLIKGVALYQLGEYNIANKTLIEGEKINTNTDLSYQFKLFLAESYQALNEFTKSKNLYLEIIEINPDDLVARNNLAYYLSLRETDLKLANELSEYTIQKDPNNATYLDTYAWILYKQNKFKDAYKYISAAVLNGGDKNPEVLEHCGDICIKNKKYDDAKYFYKKALELKPGNKAILEKLNKYE